MNKDLVIETSFQSVMLIDDDTIDNFIAERVIVMTAFARRAIVTSSTTEAIAYLNEHQFQPENLPEIIFLDINMPLNDGFDFLAKFDLLSFSITSKCKVIILSSSDYKEDIERISANDHVIKFITKPIREESLAEIRLSNR